MNQRGQTRQLDGSRSSLDLNLSASGSMSASCVRVSQGCDRATRFCRMALFLTIGNEDKIRITWAFSRPSAREKRSRPTPPAREVPSPPTPTPTPHSPPRACTRVERHRGRRGAWRSHGACRGRGAGRPGPRRAAPRAQPTAAGPGSPSLDSKPAWHQGMRGDVRDFKRRGMQKKAEKKVEVVRVLNSRHSRHSCCAKPSHDSQERMPGHLECCLSSRSMLIPSFDVFSVKRHSLRAGTASPAQALRQDYHHPRFALVALRPRARSSWPMKPSQFVSRPRNTFANEPPKAKNARTALTQIAPKDLTKGSRTWIDDIDGLIPLRWMP